MAKRPKKQNVWTPIRHKQIYLRTRGHSVDIHVYPVMQRLWDAGVQTFFSCQGGPSRFTSGDIKITNERAMIVILKDDKALVLSLLESLHPKTSKWDNRRYRDRIAIKFDPSAEAQAANIQVTSD